MVNNGNSYDLISVNLDSDLTTYGCRVKCFDERILVINLLTGMATRRDGIE